MMIFLVAVVNMFGVTLTGCIIVCKPIFRESDLCHNLAPRQIHRAR